MSSEAAEVLHLTRPYLEGNGIDLGSGGWPVVPWAIQIELPPEEFRRYNSRELPETVEWRGDIFALPFKDKVLDFVHSSHLIEDFDHAKFWPILFAEWRRVLKPGGYMVVLVPEFHRWNEAIARGQPPNLSHCKPEPKLYECSHYAQKAGFEIVVEKLTDTRPGDYTIMLVARRPLHDREVYAN